MISITDHIILGKIAGSHSKIGLQPLIILADYPREGIPVVCVFGNYKENCTDITGTENNLLLCDFFVKILNIYTLHHMMDCNEFVI